MDIFAPDATVDCEIVNALFALLYQRVAIEFPRQIFGNTVHFLHGLVHGNGSDGNRTVSDDPFTRFVDVGTR